MDNSRSVLRERANLEHLRKQAKRWLAAIRRGEADARRRLERQIGPRQRASLSDVQWALAREHGFSSWRALVARVEAAASTSAALLERVRGGDVERLRQALDERPDLVHLRLDVDPESSSADTRGHRLLHVAATCGQLEVARLLIERGAEVDALTDGRRSALHQALEHGSHSIRQLLIDAGATVDAFSAALLGDVETAREWLERNPALATDASNSLPMLGWASYGGHPEILPMLIDRGVKPEARYALVPAARCNHHGFVAAVLKLGVDPNEVVDDDGSTALHRAAGMPISRSTRESVRLLLDAGADPRRRDSQGRTPLDLARAAARDPGFRTYDDVMAMLEAALSTAG